MNPPEVVYHFTSRSCWHFIESQGIARGECPVAHSLILNWPNFTVDSRPDSQRWACWSDRLAVRISVGLDPADPAWVRWSDLTREHGMDRVTYLRYDFSGGGGARYWWIYRGVVPPSAFRAVEFLDGGILCESDRLMLAAIRETGARDLPELVRALNWSAWQVRRADVGLGQPFPPDPIGMPLELYPGVS